ncbi:MAG: hypothetical protein QM661_03810 [Solimonas sp.]
MTICCGYTLPTTREGFRELVDSLDLTTESGQETYVSLLSLASAADSYYDTLEEAADETDAARRRTPASQE